MPQLPGLTDVDWADVRRRYEAREITEEEANAIAMRGLEVLEQYLLEHGGLPGVPPRSQSRKEQMDEIERRRDTVLSECGDKVPTYKPR